MKKNHFFISIPCCFLVIFFFSSSLFAYMTENVFIVSIDGIRNEEAFEDIDHDLIPRIWNDLRPQGTIYTEFYNDSRTTFTTPGHSAMITGQWHVSPNLGTVSSVFYDVRPEAPTLFEYFRKHTGMPEEGGLIVTGKPFLIQLDWSLEPAYGPNYAPLVFQGGSDQETYDLLKEKLDTHRPALVLVNFKDVDEAGHTGDWGLYTGAIQNADDLVYQIWTQLIQGNDLYRDKTTMIVTSDHGRHDDAHGGFQEHGGMCHGCRHIPFLAIGPDTPSGKVVSGERRYQIDIVPTVGELLGFPAPLARGQVMTGIFHDTLNPDPGLHVYSKNPRVAIYDQRVFVVWSQNDSDDTGNDRVYCMKKSAGGSSFDTPSLINNPQDARWAFSPAVTANKDGLHIVWMDGRALDGNNDTWSIYYRKSADWGSAWEDEQLIATSTFEPSPEILGEPEIISSTLGELIITVRYRGGNQNKNVTSFRSQNGGKDWEEILVNVEDGFPLQYNPLALSGPKEASLVWMDLVPTRNVANAKNWEILFKRTMNGGTTWKNLARLTNDSGYSYTPMLAWSGSKLIAVWTDRDVNGSAWALQVRASGNKGRTWGNKVTIPTGTSSAWQPAVVWNQTKNEFFLVWIDLGSGSPDILSSVSDDGVNWALPTTISSSLPDTFRRNPHIAYGDGLLYVVWEELEPGTGDWLIKTASVN
ncbi:MAG: sulfatase-like hydrolase/transferase [Candidatus Brocadiaceae bacterium]|nr:sulfatase-like hydrolase/transferase [Candidatus Brocadiaceae bacterium]